MSARSKKSSPRKAPNRPFASEVLVEAKRFAAQYQVVLSCEDGEWYGHGLELPRAYGDGKTPAACVKNTRAAFVGAVACLLEQGQRPPIPAREGMRTEQVNVRLTAEEKAVLETTARRKGFKGLSDFIRSAALEAH
jgi:predicted RNase H-like HicB family nuclease